MEVLFWGRSTCDLTYLLENFPTENEKVFSEKILVQPGGPALNAAITFSYLSDKAGLLTRIGNRVNGNLIKEIIGDYKIELLDLNDSETFEIPTSIILVNSQNGSRTIINNPIENSKNLSSDKWVLNDIIRLNPQIVLIDGYELEDKIEQLKTLKSNGAKIVLDGGSWKENNLEYLHLVDIAICSDRFRYPDCDLEESIKKLNEQGIKRIAFTNGEKTITVFEYGRTTSIKTQKIDAVDTLGAGDVFHGAFCFYYLELNNFTDALIKASEIAVKSCKYFGTHTWQTEER